MSGSTSNAHHLHQAQWKEYLLQEMLYNLMESCQILTMNTVPYLVLTCSRGVSATCRWCSESQALGAGSSLLIHQPTWTVLLPCWTSRGIHISLCLKASRAMAWKCLACIDGWSQWCASSQGHHQGSIVSWKQKMFMFAELEVSYGFQKGETYHFVSRSEEEAAI